MRCTCAIVIANALLSGKPIIRILCKLTLMYIVVVLNVTWNSSRRSGVVAWRMYDGANGQGNMFYKNDNERSRQQSSIGESRRWPLRFIMT